MLTSKWYKVNVFKAVVALPHTAAADLAQTGEELEREEIGIENKVDKKTKKMSFEARMFKLTIVKQLLEIFPNYTLC